MGRKDEGRLIIIGGGEDKEGQRTILREVCRPATNGGGPLVIVTAATRVPEEYLEGYLPVFKDLGVKRIEVVDVRLREDAFADANVEKLREASVIFFTGGSQLRIASQLGGTPLCEQMHTRYVSGATIAGTSAGAAAVPDTMLIAGPSDESPDPDELAMAPGLGLLDDVVIDSHFAQRGRIGRLLAAVGQNPRNLGLGIDEDTAIVVGPNHDFSVIGNGAVYVVDGEGISYSSLAHYSRGILSLFDVKLHVLGSGDYFKWDERRPHHQNGESSKEKDR